MSRSMFLLASLFYFILYVYRFNLSFIEVFCFLNNAKDITENVLLALAVFVENSHLEVPLFRIVS